MINRDLSLCLDDYPLIFTNQIKHAMLVADEKQVEDNDLIMLAANVALLVR